MESYRDLQAWQKAMDVVVAVHKTASRLPSSEACGLTSRMRRAAVPVPADIAEGRGRRHTREFLHHLDIAYGSLTELETHVIPATRLGYVTDVETAPLLNAAAEVRRTLNGLTRSPGPDASASEHES